MTQKLKILNALQQAGREGINSYTAREQLQVIQLPTRVFELKQEGHLIVERHNLDKSVNYILLNSPKTPIRPSQPVFILVGNRAIVKEEPVQLCL